jgi:hypothetical protein
MYVNAVKITNTSVKTSIVFMGITLLSFGQRAARLKLASCFFSITAIVYHDSHFVLDAASQLS